MFSSSTLSQRAPAVNPAVSASSLGALPTDIQGLINSNLTLSEQVGLIQTSKNLRADTQSGFLSWQRKQWQLLLQGSFTKSFAQNETLLRYFGANTMVFSPEEWKAWEAAYRSLANPPPVLSEKRKLELTRELLPNFDNYRLGQMDFDSRSRYDKVYLRYSGIGGTTYIVPSLNLSRLALIEGSFLTFLKIFAVDGERLSQGTRQNLYFDDFSLLEMALMRYFRDSVEDLPRVTPGDEDFLPRELRGTTRGLLVACMLCRCGNPGERFPVIFKNGSILAKLLVSEPALVRCLILGGEDLFERAVDLRSIPQPRSFLGNAMSRLVFYPQVMTSQAQTMDQVRKLKTSIELMLDYLFSHPEAWESFNRSGTKKHLLLLAYQVPRDRYPPGNEVGAETRRALYEFLMRFMVRIGIKDNGFFDNLEGFVL